MKYLVIGIAILLSQTSCSSALLSKNELPIRFQDVEQIKLGVNSSADLKSKFGPPNDQHSINDREYAVFYDRPCKECAASYERASFVISKKTDLVLSALWLSNKEDELSNLDKVKIHFSSAKFSIDHHEKSGSHEGPLEYTLIDRTAGIWVDVIIQNQRVSAIGFNLPNHVSVGSTKQ